VKDQDKNISLIHIEKSHLYKSAIKNSVYERQWHKIIEDELLNLQLYTI